MFLVFASCVSFVLNPKGMNLITCTKMNSYFLRLPALINNFRLFNYVGMLYRLSSFHKSCSFCIVPKGMNLIRYTKMNSLSLREPALINDNRLFNYVGMLVTEIFFGVSFL